jgi:hypothetical protein
MCCAIGQCVSRKQKQGAGNVNLEEISDQQSQREQEGHRNQARSHQRRTDEAHGWAAQGHGWAAQGHGWAA